MPRNTKKTLRDRMKEAKEKTEAEVKKEEKVEVEKPAEVEKPVEVEKPKVEEKPEPVKEAPKGKKAKKLLKLGQFRITGLVGRFIERTMIQVDGEFVPVVGSMFQLPRRGKLRVLSGSGPEIEGRTTLAFGDKPFLGLDHEIVE